MAANSAIGLLPRKKVAAHSTPGKVYNTELKTFPGVLWAATFFRGNKPMAEFTANETAQTPPQVKF